MPSKDILRFMAGFRKFRETYFHQSTDHHTNQETLFHRLSTSGQSPKTLVVACSDSRVDPAIITSAGPGEMFVIRNVANLVPPFESTAGYHGVSSGIEFAVVNLKVQNVVIMGHRQCGGVRALVEDLPRKEGSFVGQWMEIAREARTRVFAKNPGADLDTLCRECERESIVTSIENLKTFPFIVEGLKNGLTIIGVYFDIEQGEMFEYEEEVGEFRQIEFNDPRLDEFFKE
jgi:carbonic anhydrase